MSVSDREPDDNGHPIMPLFCPLGERFCREML